MKQVNIQLNDTEDILEFVREAEKCEFDIDLKLGSVLIDGKSLLGVCSLGLAKNVTVQYHGESPEFMKAIQKFAVA
ncbi:MAG: HPr family phosphocarrier protein [Lachnospiraceae bacterium]|nr:HPr family phosphocarrier protein [Lachnospiraceae bacterium]